MNGTVKWFSKEKGYGFIYVPGTKDYFFHVSQLQGAELPNNGDSVTFEEKHGKDGKLSAVNVVVTKKASRTPDAPYYGKATYKVETTPGTRGIGAVGLGTVGALIGGPIGGLIGGILGAAFGDDGEEQKIEITSPCLRCGGTGQVTSRVDGRIGFQCPRCKKYWTKRDDY